MKSGWWIYPAIQGRGKGLVAEGTVFPISTLLQSKTFPSGVALLRYAIDVPAQFVAYVELAWPTATLNAR